MRDRSEHAMPGVPSDSRTERASATSRSRKHARGQSIVEFALVLPVLLLLLLLAVDFGRLFFTYIAINNAAREATYYAAAHAADDPFVQADYVAAISAAGEREANVQGQGSEGDLIVGLPVCSTSGGAVLDCHSASDFATGIRNQVVVSTGQTFSFLTPFIGDLFGGEVNLTASATGPVFSPPNPTVGDNPDPPAPPPACPQPAFEWVIASEPLTVEFTDASTGEPSSWAWDFGDESSGENSSAIPDPVHEYSGDGNYTVTLTVNDADGCSPYSAVVTVGDATPPDPDPDPVSCVVPDYYHTWWDNAGGIAAEQLWTGAGFTGALTNNAGKKLIQSQTASAGSSVSCALSMSVSDKT